MKTVRNYKLLFVCIFITHLNFIQAQYFSHSSYTIKDGLPSDIITTIFQDRKGYIWLGTNNGLSVYNAKYFRNFSVVDGLSNNWITTITESPDEPGTIWIGTIAGGLNKYKDGKFEKYSFNSNSDSNNVGSIAFDSDGVLWFTTYYGLWKLKDNKIFKVNEPSAPNKPQLIISGREGNLWCAQKNFIYLRNSLTSKWKQLNLGLNQNDSIVSIFASSAGFLWAGTKNKLILKLDSTGVKQKGFCKYGPAFVIAEYNNTLIIRSNDIFFNISEKNLLLQKLTPVPHNSEMPIDVTSPFLYDREANLWVGTWQKGLLKIPSSSLNLLKFPSDKKLNSSSFDKFGHLFTSFSGGLIEMYKDNYGNWQQFLHYFNKKWEKGDNYILTIDKENRIWLSDSKKGVIIFKVNHLERKPSRLEAINPTRILNYININTLLNIYPDNNDRIWISQANKKLYLFDSKTFRLLKIYIPEENIPSSETKVIFQDTKNKIWLGGWSDGISVFDQQIDDSYPSFKLKLTKEDGLPDNMIRSVYEDKYSNVWVGTRHHGVAYLNNGQTNSVKNFSIKEGLLSNSVWKITEGPDNNIWIMSDVGIEQVNQTNFEVQPAKNEFLISGLISVNNFNNKIWSFNNADDIYICEPSELTIKSSSPPVEIIKILVNGNPASSDEISSLSYSQNNITVEFTALTFKDERAIRYQFRLLGAEDNWSKPTENNSVSFAALKSGAYIFEVRAINSDGTISKTPASIKFDILPPIWLRWWFVSLIISLILLVTYAGIRIRLNRLIEVEKLRLKIARDLHDNVGTNLSTIILSSQIMSKKFTLTEQQIQHLNNMSLTASMTQELLREIVWILNPKNDNPEDLIMRLKSIASQILQDIPYNFHTEEKLFPNQLQIDLKKNIILILKETLQNIIKHSKATKVNIELFKENNTFKMKISDNGIGFNINDVRKGNGIINIYERAKNIKGEISIISKPREGTIVILSIDSTQMRNGRFSKIKIN